MAHHSVGLRSEIALAHTLVGAIGNGAVDDESNNGGGGGGGGDKDDEDEDEDGCDKDEDMLDAFKMSISETFLSVHPRGHEFQRHSERASDTARHDPQTQQKKKNIIGTSARKTIGGGVGGGGGGDHEQIDDRNGKRRLFGFRGVVVCRRGS